LAEWRAHRGGINVVAFLAREGNTFFTGSDDGTARSWGLAADHTVMELAVYKGHNGSVKCLAPSPDGQTVLTGSDDGTARLWEVATGNAHGPEFLHQKEVRAVAFGPDPRTPLTALTASADGTARLWDVRTGKPLGPPLRHNRPLSTAAFAPDGNMVLTASEDGAARLWEVPNRVEGDVGRIVLWVQAITGKELDERGSLRELDPSGWEQRRRQLAELGGPPE
jgi:hypothetical protein